MTKMATPVELEQPKQTEDLDPRTYTKRTIDGVTVISPAPSPHHPLEMAVCMGMDAMRLCLGMPPRNYRRDEIEDWMDAMAKTETKP